MSPDVEIIFVDRVADRNDGSGWVKGDPRSADPDANVAGSAELLMMTGLP